MDLASVRLVEFLIRSSVGVMLISYLVDFPSTVSEQKSENTGTRLVGFTIWRAADATDRMPSDRQPARRSDLRRTRNLSSARSGRGRRGRRYLPTFIIYPQFNYPTLEWYRSALLTQQGIDSGIDLGYDGYLPNGAWKKRS